MERAVAPCWSSANGDLACPDSRTEPMRRQLAPSRSTRGCQSSGMHVADQLVLASGMGEEFLRFLQRQARVYPTQELHLVVDNHRTHKHPVVRAWLADNPRIHLHFTPIGGSWMNQVETWFSILQRRAIARGVFRSVPTLVAAIGRFLTGWNNNSRPFAWIKPADVILAKANRLRIPESVH